MCRAAWPGVTGDGQTAARPGCENRVLFPSGEERHSLHCSTMLNAFCSRCCGVQRAEGTGFTHRAGDTQSISAFQGRTELQPAPRTFQNGNWPLTKVTNGGFSGNFPAQLHTDRHIMPVPCASTRPPFHTSRCLPTPLHFSGTPGSFFAVFPPKSSLNKAASHPARSHTAQHKNLPRAGPKIGSSLELSCASHNGRPTPGRGVTAELCPAFSP